METKKVKSTCSPKDANKSNKLYGLTRDNKSFGDYWILVDEHNVYIHEQAFVYSSTQQIVIPKRKFNALINWYTKPQKVVKR